MEWGKKVIEKALEYAQLRMDCNRKEFKAWDRF